MNRFNKIHTLKSLTNKEINFKLSYLIILILISALSIGTYYSYAIFTVNKEKSGVLSIIRNNLNFELSGNNLINNKVIAKKNSKTYIKVNIKNLNSIKVKYALCYKNNLPPSVSVNYYVGTKNLPNGEINPYLDVNNNVDVVLVLNNTGDKDEEITLNVILGLPDYDLVVPKDFSIIDKGSGAFGDIKDFLLNEEVNSYNFDNSDSTYSYIVGNNPNNYLWYSGKLWRIIGINKDNNSIKLITDDIISLISYHSDSSIINFSSSHAYSFLNNDFYNSLRNPNSYLVDTVFNATKIDNNDKPGNDTLVTSKVGLLSRYEYSKLNYLGNEKNFLLINPTTNNRATYVDDTNKVKSIDATSFLGLRPVISLKSNIKIVEGMGSKNSPYRLENDKDLTTDLKGQKLNTRYSGEYVRFNNQLFRIVNIFNNNTKIVSVNAIGDKIKYNIDQVNSYEVSNLYNYLNNTWYNSLSNIEKDMINKDNYNIQLPRVGELFTGYVGSDKKAYFAIDSNDNAINVVNSNASLSSVSVTDNEYNVKLSLYLKDNVVIVSGDGTINNPFSFVEDSKEVTNSRALSNVLEDITHLGLSGRYLNMENEKFIIGENPNNYVWYSNRLWRAVSIITKNISEEGENYYVKQVKLITNEIEVELPRYHKEYSSDFATSYAYSYLNNDFYNTLENPSKYIDFSYSYNATLSTNNSIPSNLTMINSRVGLLNRYEYYKLSTDTIEKNYLNINAAWWLITPYNSNNVNYVNSTGAIDNSNATSIKGIRPVIVMKGDILVVSGSGIYTNPYRILST